MHEECISYVMTSLCMTVTPHIIAGPEKVTKITKAACSRHNYLKISEMRPSVANSRQYSPPGYVDHRAHSVTLSQATGDLRLLQVLDWALLHMSVVIEPYCQLCSVYSVTICYLGYVHVYKFVYEHFQDCRSLRIIHF